jgi:chromosome partitioning protein
LDRGSDLSRHASRTASSALDSHRLGIGDVDVRTIAVVNRKGGSGKTTTAVSIAAALAERGLAVLLIDLDPQGSASAWLAEGPDDHGRLDAFVGTQDLGAIAVRTRVPGLQIVRASAWLLTAERTLMGDLSVGVVRAVERLKPDWAFVIIDCPPSLSYLSVGALMAVREVIIPVEAHSIALPGVAAVVSEIGRIQSTLNPVLRNPLIVACRVNRTLHARKVIAELDRTYGWLLARVSIRESIRLAEAEAARLPITEFAPDSGACLDYRQLAEELVAREGLPEPSPRRGSRWRQLFGRSANIAALRRRAV